MNHQVKIIGIGSPFGDDRFGWEAAQALRHSPVLDDDSSGWIEITILDRPGALLPLHWQGADIVILLDAVRSGATPGTRHRLDACDLPGAGGSCSSHGFGIASAIGLARALGNMPSRLLLRGVEADPGWSGSGLSPGVAATLPAFVRDIAEEALSLPGFHASAAVNST
ncbi:hydrogenase [Sulfuricaulis limicola]|uniref:Hydrogenase n=1 Tax=Sulfuricaulis limicola TaxID=1620215 RepID=A0A1B4XHZ2_9GAMM|nr:hydrogenase maturation protease [Sulfuricaulis limicola]BAV34412.1 hydrogenase [Sulfuricaulis limicola]